MSETGAAPIPTSPSAGLVVVTCPSWEALRDDVARSLAVPPLDPFAGQLVVCDQPAARRDLAQSLAQRLGTDETAGGICAGVEFVGLSSLRRHLGESLLGQGAATDPWRSRGLTLGVFDVMQEVGDEPWFTPIAHHLSQGGRPGRRFATADRVARLLLRYVHDCPSLVRAWNTGHDVGPDGEPLPAGTLWQPRIWRLVSERLATQGSTDPLTRHADLLAAVATARNEELLPRGDHCLRLVDPVPCSPLDRELVAALAERIDVRLWVLEGSGRVRDTAFDRWVAQASSVERCAGGIPPEPAFTFHASHGPDRQVEVLRETLCALLQDDPTLEPRDVVVACPDLGTFAPLVRAAFCLDDEMVGTSLHPGHGLRVQLAGSSISQPNHVLDTLGRVLHLATDRATAQDLVDLCASRPVACRFGLGEDDQERIARLVGQSDVRWGLDAQHREGFGLAQVRQSTWLAGVERILVGVAMGPKPLRWVGTALPVEQVDSSDVAAAGALAEIVSRVRKLMWQWRSPAPVGDWIARLTEALDLLCATEQDDAWMLSSAHAELADLADLTLDRTAELTLADVRAMFDRLVRPRTGRSSHGNGSLMVGGLEDIAHVPHRVLVVLGLDDQRFPARPALDGDDLTSWHTPEVEVDPRALSRQLLEDAVASAREGVIVIHQAATTRTNHPVPRPVAVVDLMQRAGITNEVEHSLQPQAPSNFAVGGGQGPASFDRQALAGARAHLAFQATPPQPVTPLWAQDFPSAVPSAGNATDVEVDLGSLVDFYRHPARALLRHTLGLSMGEWDDALPDEIPVEPNALAEWSIGDRMVRLLLDGMPMDRVEAAERLRGEVPPGQLGSRTLNKIRPVVGRVVSATQHLYAEPARDLDCELALGQSLLTGRVRVHGPVIVSHGFSRTGAAHLVQAWASLLLLAATQPAPTVGWRAVHVGRDAVATLLAPPPKQAAKVLGEMLAVREQGLVRLVPLPLRTAGEFRGVIPLRPYGEPDLDDQGRRAFGYEYDADWARFLPKDFESLRRLSPDPNDPGVPGPSRFENLSDWLFAPLRAQMTVGNLK